MSGKNKLKPRMHILDKSTNLSSIGVTVDENGKPYATVYVRKFHASVVYALKRI